MIQRALVIFLGGGLGSILRFYLGWRLNLTYGHFPFGTLLANVVSSFILGLLMAYYMTNPSWREDSRLFLMTGFCGGFSTFSTFSSEVVLLLKEGQTGLAFFYLGISVLLGLLAIYLGMKVYGLR